MCKKKKDICWDSRYSSLSSHSTTWYHQRQYISLGTGTFYAWLSLYLHKESQLLVGLYLCLAGSRFLLRVIGWGTSTSGEETLGLELGKFSAVPLCSEADLTPYSSKDLSCCFSWGIMSNRSDGFLNLSWLWSSLLLLTCGQSWLALVIQKTMYIFFIWKN